MKFYVGGGGFWFGGRIMKCFIVVYIRIELLAGLSFSTCRLNKFDKYCHEHIYLYLHTNNEMMMMMIAKIRWIDSF